MRTKFLSIRFFAFAALIALAITVLFSSYPQQTFANTNSEERIALEDANSRYRRGEFSDAERLYHELLLRGVENGYLYYNLANAQYRLGKFGTAIVNYRRALLRLPRELDIAANLSLAKKQVTASFPQENAASFHRFLFLNYYFSPYELGAAALVAYCCLWAAFALMPWSKVNWLRNLSFGCAFLSGLLFLSAYAVQPAANGEFRLAITPAARALKAAVVVSKEAKVYAGDAESFQVIFVLKEGTELNTAQSRNEWIQALLPGARRGWIKRLDLEVL